MISLCIVLTNVRGISQSMENPVLNLCSFVCGYEISIIVGGKLNNKPSPISPEMVGYQPFLELKVHDWVYHITSINGILLDKCHNSLTWKYLLFGDSYPYQPSSLYIYIWRERERWPMMAMTMLNLQIQVYIMIRVCSNALTILMIQWYNSIIAKQSNPLEVDTISWFIDMIILVTCFLMFTFYLHHDGYIYIYIISVGWEAAEELLVSRNL